MIRITAGTYASGFGTPTTPLGDTDSVNFVAGPYQGSYVKTTTPDGNGGATTTTTRTGRGGKWIADTSTSFSMTVTDANGESDDGNWIIGVNIEVYTPTISASGGGSMTEVGHSNGVGFGSGTATFTVSRDLPAGWQGEQSGDAPVPDTTVTVQAEGSAKPADYVSAPGSEPHPQSSVQLTSISNSKSYTIMPVDDSESEPSDPSNQPIAPETIIWTVTQTDPTPPLSSTIQVTATITDDSAWLTDGWQYMSGLTHYASEPLGSWTDQNGNEWAFTKKYKWISLGSVPYFDLSDGWGEKAEVATTINLSNSVTWGGSGNADFDFSSFGLPLNVGGEISREKGTETGISKPVSGSEGGTANTRYAVAGYALYAYIEKRLLGVNPPQPGTIFYKDLGYTGEIAIGKWKMTRDYRDEEDWRTNTTTNASSPPNFTPPAEWDEVVQS